MVVENSSLTWASVTSIGRLLTITLLPWPLPPRGGNTTGGCWRFAWLTAAAAAELPSAAAFAPLPREELDLAPAGRERGVCLRFVEMISSRAGMREIHVHLSRLEACSMQRGQIKYGAC